MQFSEGEWRRLNELQNRCQLDNHSRQALLNQVFADNAAISPVAKLLLIPGTYEFFQLLNDLIVTTDDDDLLTRLMECLLRYTLNKGDITWLAEQIERRKMVRLPSQETQLLHTAFRSVLDSDSNLREGLLAQAKELDQFYFTRPPGTTEDLVAGYFSHIFPLQCFRRTLSEFEIRGLFLESSTTRRNIIVCKDLFVIASFPDSDKKKMVDNMQEAWENTVRNRAFGTQSLETADKQFAEDLLISTWIQISGRKFDNLEILDLLHRDPTNLNSDKDRKSLLFAKVHLLSQPTDVDKSSDLRTWYANRCLDELRGPRGNPSDPVQTLNKLIKQLTDMNAVVAMFITKDRTETIKELKSYFPQLVLIELSQTDADRYSDIQSEISLIDRHVENICKSN